MFITKNLQKNITFLVFTLLVAVMLSGAVSAALEAPVDYSSAYVVENNYSFTGPASIQDAADNYETLEGYHIDVETGAHEEQVTFTKTSTKVREPILRHTIWTYSEGAGNHRRHCYYENYYMELVDKHNQQLTTNLINV